MGRVLCNIACLSNEESLPESVQFPLSGSSSLSSLPSLPSVPSLSTSHSQNSSTHHQCISTLKAHSSYVFTLALADKSLYSASSDGEMRVWHPPPQGFDLKHVDSNTVGVARGAVKSLVILRDKLISAHQDHRIRIWRINCDKKTDNYKLLATLPTLKDRVVRYLMPKNHVKVSRHKTCTWVHHVDAISALALSRDGSTLYSVSWDRSLKIWRTSDFTCQESVANAHDDAINAITTSVDGFIYTGSADTKIKVWNKTPGEKKHCLVATLEKHRSTINALALSSDESTLYSGACDRSIVVWERTKGGSEHMAVVGALRGHNKAILCLAVVSDLVLSGSADKTVRIWRRGMNRNYTCLGVLEGHRGAIKCVTAVVEGYNSRAASTSYLIYSGSLDSDIKVWQLLLSSFERLDI